MKIRLAKRTQLILSFAVLLTLSATACTEKSTATSREVQSSIDRALRRGSSAADIERFFREQNLPYTYDRFANRYQSVIRGVSDNPGIDQAIVIHVYVDDARTFTRAEVRDSFTLP